MNHKTTNTFYQYHQHEFTENTNVITFHFLSACWLVSRLVSRYTSMYVYFLFQGVFFVLYRKFSLLTDIQVWQARKTWFS